MKNDFVLTVSQLNCYIKSLLDSNNVLANVFLKGEISNFTNHYKSGHFYFSLKDQNSVIKAIMFSTYASKVKFKPEDGMNVIVRGRVTVYEASGQYQLYVEDIQPDGIGALNLAFEQLKSKLKAEGLFDLSNKKLLPKFPNRIGIITSDTGAAIQDIKQILSRRYPIAELIICPTLVQGEGAARQIIEAINKFNELEAADVLIIGRGGGSVEDLWAFNSENLARTIVRSKIPIISAVGHETDFTICDFAADLRAPTPSAAAELVAPSKDELKQLLGTYVFSIELSLKAMITKSRTKIDSLMKCHKFISPMSIIQNKSIMLDLSVRKLNDSFKNVLYNNKKKFILLNSKLDMLSPLKVLSRGYSIVTKKGKNKLISNKNKIKLNDTIQVRLSDGEIDCLVKEIR